MVLIRYGGRSLFQLELCLHCILAEKNMYEAIVQKDFFQQMYCLARSLVRFGCRSQHKMTVCMLEDA